ncbi:MAG: hypothetical protein KA807_06345 [Prolixibacteraceae bacterium]|nr:hypothetical protein [Prolixibacteraceae bacterium]
MIESKEDYCYYLEADRIAKAIPKKLCLRQRLINLFFPNYVWKFQKSLRKVEYFKNRKKNILTKLEYFLVYKRYKKLSYKLGFSIPPNVFGPGLSIAHHGTIIVNSAARIGANCRLHACVNIGTKAGYGGKAPVIGDNCYIGPGAKIFGDIKIGNNIAIGANAVVNKSFEGENMIIAGVPAKVISGVDVFKILIPATIIIDKGLGEEAENLIQENRGTLSQAIRGFID